MSGSIEQMIKKALISGSREDLDMIMGELSIDEQKELLGSILDETSNILNDSKLDNVKTRPLLFYLINNAEKRGREEGRDVFITYLDQRKLGKINNEYGPEVGDKAIYELTSSLHKGLVGIKKSDYDIIRMGGDEFCLVTIGASKEELTEYLKEAKTIANTTELYKDDVRVKEKIDFAFGSRKLDYSKGKTLRNIIDMAKNETYYQKMISKAEEIAEQSKLFIKDDDLVTQKKLAIESYIDNVLKIKNSNQHFDYMIIPKKEDAKNNTKRKTSDIDSNFVIKLNEIASSKGVKRQTLIDELCESDIDYLKDNFMKFGESFIDEGEKNIVKRTSSELLFDSLSDEEKSTMKMKYVELDNLKLVNEARTHIDGDKYISDFMTMVTESFSEAENPLCDSYAIKMAGNAIVVLYNEDNENIFESLLEKTIKYEDKEINIPMDVYMEDMNIDSISDGTFEFEYIDASDRAKVEKDKVNLGIQKIISCEDDYKIFYQRESFTMSEVMKVAEEEGIDVSDILNEIDNEVNEQIDLLNNHNSNEDNQEI